MDGEFQSAHFGKQAHVSMEGYDITLAVPSDGSSELALSLQNNTHEYLGKALLSPAVTQLDGIDQAEDSAESDDESIPRTWTEITLFNSFLSDEKRQDSGTVALNIKVMLTNLVVRGDIILSTFEELVSIVDGCSGQYRSGSVCYQLCNIAKAFNIVYDRIIHPPGHGKCSQQLKVRRMQ